MYRDTIVDMIDQYTVQRRFERHVLSPPLEIMRRPPYGTAPLPGLTMEIAEGGFSAMISDELKIGETVTARIPLTGLDNLLVAAVVRNKNLFRYGFQFLGLTDEVRSTIIQACKCLPVYEGGWH